MSLSGSPRTPVPSLLIVIPVSMLILIRIMLPSSPTPLPDEGRA